MKKMLKVLPLLIASIVISGCGNSPQSSSTSKTSQPINLPDRDFDGLKNEIDPDPDNNIYEHHITMGEEKTPVINDGYISFDFSQMLRDDIYSEYNTNLASLAAFMVQDSYDFDIEFKNNKYITESSKISKLLTQLGCEDIMKTHMSADQFGDDVLDLINFKIGHHLVDDGNKKLNVFLVEMRGYDDFREWSSNFDFGVDVPLYYELFGDHEEWTDKNAHKGFYIAAERAYSLLTEYMTSHIIDGVDNFAFISGHSRSAATGSLLAKKLKDNNIKSLAYLFNVPANYASTNEELLKSYTNIWSILNEDDLVGMIPLKEWDNFTQLGHICTYKFSDKPEYYELFFDGRSFPQTDGKFLPLFKKSILKLLPSRGDVFTFKKADPQYKEVILGFLDTPFDTESDAQEKIDEIFDAFSDPDLMKKIINMEIVPYSEDNSKFQINYKTMPQVLFSLINEIFCCDKTIFSILGIVSSYLPILGRYLNDINEMVEYMMNDLTNIITFITYSHDQNQTIVAALCANEVA